VIVFLSLMISSSVFAEGYLVTSDLWIRAVINTVEKGPVDAIWQKGGEDITSRGDHVIWGHFYANPSDVTWGSENNPDLFVKIWFDVSGRVDVNYFHVSVPDIEVYSDYPYDGTPDEHGTTTMSRRYIRQYYENGQCHSEDKCEDGNPPSGYTAMGNPSGYSIINDLTIGSIINTIEKGPIDAVWRFGGQDTTARGDEVVWGHFYADPLDVTWGSQDNPDLFVKIWFDVSGRVDVNFFHVSVPEIEVYSDYPENGTYDQMGTTIMSDRYIRHEYGTTYNIVDYFPLAQGDTWIYREEDMELTIKIISGTEFINGVNAAKMIDEDGDYQLWTNSNGIAWHKEYDADDIPGCGWSQMIFNPPFNASGPVVSVGSTYASTSTLTATDCTGISVTASVSYEFRIEGVEDVTVFAGTFNDCIKIKGNLTTNYTDGSTATNEMTIWLAEDLGQVKFISISSDGTTTNIWTEDLVSSVVGGVTYP
jgi:hypothetical protein